MTEPLDDTAPLPDAARHVVALLPEWLPTQRWFSGKSRPVSSARLAGVTRLKAPAGDGPEVLHLMVEVRQDGTPTVYQVPVSIRTEPVARLEHARIGTLPSGAAVYDALHDKDATAALLRGFVDGPGAPAGAAAPAGGPPAGLRFRVEPGAAIPLGEPSIVSPQEQSNTSVVFGDAAILKVFRRPSPGVNPDVEVHDVLTRAGCPYVADLLGWFDGDWSDSEGERSGSAGMLQRYLVTATDGWALATASVRDLYAEGDLHADEVGGDFAGEAARLGQATAHVHQALAAELPTGTFGHDDVGALAHEMGLRLENAVGEVPAVAAWADELRKAFDDLATIDEPVPVQRVHGDLHLGQALRTVVGWKLLDFEGEPERPLADRVRLDATARDVAGMLRSFDYAARHLQAADHADDPQIAYRAAEWAQRNRDAFCDGYAEVAGAHPAEPPALLRAYEIDKAVYEAVYEARNRPSWLPVPLAALERLAGA